MSGHRYSRENTLKLWRIVLTAAAVVSVNSTAAAEDRPYLLPHSATYEFRPEKTGGSAAINANGTLTYTIRKECGFWSAGQKQTLRIAWQGGVTVESITDRTTLESDDGRTLRFRMTEKINNMPARMTDGEASLTADGQGEVRYEHPKKKKMHLPFGTLFPQAYTRALLNAEQQGRSDLSSDVFDGASAEGARYVYARLGRREKFSGKRAETGLVPALAELPFSQIHLSFYSGQKDAMLPETEISMQQFIGGVTGDMIINRADVRLHGVMTDFRLLPPAKHCPQERSSP